MSSDQQNHIYESIHDFQPSLNPRDVKTFPVRQALTSLNTDRNNKGLDPVDLSPLDDWTISPTEANLAEKEKRKPKNKCRDISETI